MQELLVLGIIPGTNIQITFEMWIIAVSFGLGIASARTAHKRRLFVQAAVTLAVMLQTRRQPA